MQFEEAMPIILRHEGGYVFDSQDPGGETNYGISKRQYPNLDIKNLTIEDAIQIYRKDYWDKLKLNLIPSKLRLCVFDCAVNQGVTRATRILQGAVGAKQDGILGPETFHAARTYGDVEALSNIAQLRLNHYSKLPHWPKFGYGWTKRLLDITIISLSR